MYLYLVYTLASIVIGFPILKLLRLWFLAISSAYHHVPLINMVSCFHAFCNNLSVYHRLTFLKNAEG